MNNRKLKNIEIVNELENKIKKTVFDAEFEF